MLLFSCSAMSDSLWPNGLQHARLPCPSLSPWVCSNSCPLSLWCHQPSHPLSLPSPLALNLSQHWSLFQWVGCLHQVAYPLGSQKIYVTHFIAIFALLPWSKTEPAISSRYFYSEIAGWTPSCDSRHLLGFSQLIVCIWCWAWPLPPSIWTSWHVREARLMSLNGYIKSLLRSVRIFGCFGKIFDFGSQFNFSPGNIRN